MSSTKKDCAVLAGEVYLQFLLEHLSTHGTIPFGIPVPALFETEDGWEFELNRDRTAYESPDGMNLAAIEFIQLMLMEPDVRDNHMFPEFCIKNWERLDSRIDDYMERLVIQ